jgi:hypothetical protein
VPPGACASIEALTFIKLKSLTIEFIGIERTQGYYSIATEEHEKIKALLFREQISFATDHFNK